MEPIIPKDIPLPLPAPFWLLVVLLLISFAAHIAFVGLMVGGTLVSFVAEIMGLKNRDWDTVARKIGDTITVNKSLAVVLGVAPLLTINVLYTVYFYTANIITSAAWLWIIPLVITAFLLGYAHKYTWDQLQNHKVFHISLVGMAGLLFLIIPTIFLSNVNLMLYPELWARTTGYLDALSQPNVLPRYFHFLMAVFAETGLFLAFYLGRESFFEKMGLKTITRTQLVRSFYLLAFAPTAAQLFFGPFLFYTLPPHAVSLTILPLLGIVIILAIVSLSMMWKEIRDPVPLRRFWPIVGVIGTIVAIMIYVRHNIRETAIAPHRALMEAKTANYMAQVRRAQNYVVIPGGLGGRPMSPGERLFQQTCASCHAVDRRLVGPPIPEAVSFYANDPEGIVQWAMDPGKRRADYPKMPAQQLPRADLMQIAQYMLTIGAGGGQQTAPGGATPGAPVGGTQQQAPSAGTQ